MTTQQRRNRNVVVTNTNDNNFFNLSMSNPPITKYCVEHVLPPQSLTTSNHHQAQKDFSLPSDVFADYISCNGPEAEPRTHPEDPLCICEVFADRMIALQTAAEMDAACGKAVVDPTTGTHSAPDCNCSGSKWNISNTSALYIGAATVWEPYFYYQLPKNEYPGTHIAGLWYSTPSGGACSEEASVGDNGCTWKRHARAEAIFGAQLMSAGWNNTVRTAGFGVLK